MEDFVIQVHVIEDLQTLEDVHALDALFDKAKKTMVGGMDVVLTRKQLDGSLVPFERFTRLDELAAYKKQVYKYIV